MQKIKKNLYIMLVICLLFANCIDCSASETDIQKYYLLYMIDIDGNVVIEIGEDNAIKEYLSDDVIFENLSLFPIKNGAYHPFQMKQLEDAGFTREIREYLLYSGYAQIVDETIAEAYELEAQDHARENSLGGWNEEIETDGQIETKLQKETGSKAKAASANIDDGNAITRFFNKLKVKLVLEWSLHKIFLITIVVIVIIIIVAVVVIKKSHSIRRKNYRKRKDVIKKRYKQELKKAREELKDSFADTLNFTEETSKFSKESRRR